MEPDTYNLRSKGPRHDMSGAAAAPEPGYWQTEPPRSRPEKQQTSPHTSQVGHVRTACPCSSRLHSAVQPSSKLTVAVRPLCDLDLACMRFTSLGQPHAAVGLLLTPQQWLLAATMGMARLLPDRLATHGACCRSTEVRCAVRKGRAVALHAGCTLHLRVPLTDLRPCTVHHIRSSRVPCTSKSPWPAK